ncbi:MAG: sel1 repeat family protein [Pseudomonadota bacterium]
MSATASEALGVAPVLSGEEMYKLGLEASVSDGEQEADLVSAHMWFNLAALRGNLEARAYRAELAMQMTSAEVAEAQRQARAFLSEQRAVA